MEVATEEEEEAATAVVATEAAAVVVTEEEEEEIMVAVMADAVEEEAAVTDLTIPLMVEEEAEATEAEMEAAEMGVETAEGVTTTKTVEAHSQFFNFIFSPARVSNPTPFSMCLLDRACALHSSI